MSFKTKFANLGHPNKIWVVSAIHGDVSQLTELHKNLYRKFKPGDRLIYTGNYFCGDGGHAPGAPLATLAELLHFREALLALPGFVPDDIICLRGIQEELWGKLLQLSFAPDAGQVVEWIATRHPALDQLLAAYGTSLAELARISREGILNLTRWSAALKTRLRGNAGHEKFFTSLRLAAFTEHKSSNDNNLLFVHAGLDPSRPLAAQGDGFWWSARGFNHIETPYRPFRTVIRGFDPEGQGIHIGPAVVSLDGGCGRGGKLVCAQLSNIGDIIEILS